MKEKGKLNLINKWHYEKWINLEKNISKTYFWQRTSIQNILRILPAQKIKWQQNKNRQKSWTMKYASWRRLARMWNNWTAHIILERMRNSTITLENSLAIFYKVKIYLVSDPAIPFLYSREMQTNIYKSIAYKSS